MNDADPHGLNILVDPVEEKRHLRTKTAQNDPLTQWVMARVDAWEQHRNSNYGDDWREYRRIYETEWEPGDKERQVERSRLMPTAAMEAVDDKVSDLIDGVFFRQNWLDIADDVSDQDRSDTEQMAMKLREDVDRNGYKQALSEACLNGGIYGTVIVKLALTESEDKIPTIIRNRLNQVVLSGVQTKKSYDCKLIPIRPDEFVIDPAAKCVQDAQGVAHITAVPNHTIFAKQRSGIYQRGPIGDYTEGQQSYESDYDLNVQRLNQDRSRLVEYHGLVPEALLPGSKAKPDVKAAINKGQIDHSTKMVEAIVTIANDSFLLKAVKNPFTRKDRSIIAAQWHCRPGKFWGIGDIEKAYHPQKALQTEMRARADGLALANYPIVYRDIDSISGEEVREGQDAKILEPGKEYYVVGNPAEKILQFKFQGPDSNSSIAIGDYNSMVRSATGSDQGSVEWKREGSSNSPKLRSNKRTFLSIEEDLLKPIIDLTAWRYMQFRPERYPPIDFRFSVMGAVSIKQREAEQSMLVSLLQALPEGSPAFYALLRVIVTNGTYVDRPDVLAIIDSQISAALNPPPPPPDLAGQARLISAEHRKKEHSDQMMLEYERLKREDLELILKGKGMKVDAMQQPAAPQQGGNNGGELNINLNAGNKRVRIRRTDDGLVGETEEVSDGPAQKAN